MPFFPSFISLLWWFTAVPTAVTLGVIPLFIALTFVASPAIKAQLRKAAEKMAATQALLVEALNGVQTIKAQMQKIQSVGVGSAAILIHEREL